MTIGNETYESLQEIPFIEQVVIFQNSSALIQMFMEQLSVSNKDKNKGNTEQIDYSDNLEMKKIELEHKKKFEEKQKWLSSSQI